MELVVEEPLRIVEEPGTKELFCRKTASPFFAIVRGIYRLKHRIS